MSKTAILLSGGMDSIALAYWKRPEIAITIDYGQKPAAAEVVASKRGRESSWYGTPSFNSGLFFIGGW